MIILDLEEDKTIRVKTMLNWIPLILTDGYSLTPEQRTKELKRVDWKRKWSAQGVLAVALLK